MWPFLGVYTWGESEGALLKRTLILLDQGPNFMTSINLNYFLRVPNSKYSHTGGQGFNV